MIAAIAVVVGVSCLAAGFLIGYVAAHRRLPTTLARMSEEGLRQLAAVTVARRVFPSESAQPAPSIDERVDEALAASRFNAIFRREQGL